MRVDSLVCGVFLVDPDFDESLDILIRLGDQINCIHLLHMLVLLFRSVAPIHPQLRRILQHLPRLLAQLDSKHIDPVQLLSRYVGHVVVAKRCEDGRQVLMDDYMSTIC